MQYYLPSEGTFTKDFLRDVLAGKKHLLKKKKVNHIHVTKYDEISVKGLYPHFKNDKEFLQYFPDKYPKDKGPPREYFFDILNTVHPEYLKQVIQHADEERYAAWGTDQKAQTIKVSQYWQEELDSMPYLSCKSFRISSDQQKKLAG